ncbi:hypothetical protein KOR42_53450 [Thalassoglobus neptunius]|uniref:Ice-binding protein C-terminal domain-containing protein n=1 Tax=Thalassoglobus neptunius TaxID=1938619 RepID=A0A5C5VAU9_9PLAN|nr:PEP-CTERM sorting domain-containing protein [Thalassoglobus neptunius]TWT34979.1 hypothetical protein KOR42_53450 [Thalassoglobus neptunius]
MSIRLVNWLAVLRQLLYSSGNDHRGAVDGVPDDSATPPVTVDFDLGGLFMVDSFSIWNSLSNGGILNFNLLASQSSDFSSATTIGAFQLIDLDTHESNQGNSVIAPAEFADFAAVSASYMRIEITRFLGEDLIPPRGADVTIANEVVFGGTRLGNNNGQVPEPSSMILFGLGLLSACRAKRIRVASK